MTSIVVGFEYHGEHTLSHGMFPLRDTFAHTHTWQIFKFEFECNVSRQIGIEDVYERLSIQIGALKHSLATFGANIQFQIQ